MWAQRPATPATPATLPSMNAVRHARPGVTPERPPSSARVAAAPSREGGPRRTGTLKMPAVRPFEDATPPSGRMLDDLDFLSSEHPPVALELGALPAGHGAQATMAGGKLPQSVRFTPRPMEAVRAPSSARTRAARDLAAAPPGPPSAGRIQVSSLELEALASPPTELATSVSPFPVVPPPVVDPRPGVVAFAGFGIVPDRVAELPTYAFRVLARRRVLREGLKLARARRPQDVELYEAALACADDDAVTKGLGLALAVLVLGVAAVVAAATFVL